MNYCATYQIVKNVQSTTFISDRKRGETDISSTCFEIIRAIYNQTTTEFENINRHY